MAAAAAAMHLRTRAEEAAIPLNLTEPAIGAVKLGQPVRLSNFASEA
jgi:hypothetical protein